MRAAFWSAVCVLCATTSAYATPYEVFVDVDEEGDLQDLLAAGTLTEDTYNELLDLLGRGVDLSTADRSDLYALPNLTYEDVDSIIAYRQLQRGRITDPAELVTAGVISEAKLLAISSFLIVRTPGQDPLALRGFARVMTRGTTQDFSPNQGDPFVPPLGLRARFTALKHLTVGGVLTTTRLRPGAPVWDPVRGALVAEPRGTDLVVPKAYARWQTDSFDGIAGSFRAGFGQRLVFDNSTTYTPNGFYLDDQLFFSADLATACKESTGELISSPCAGAAGSEYVTPDFVWRNGLFGVALGAKRLELSSGWLQGYAFASASRRSIYQYELVNRGTCADPHDDSDPGCSAPDVFVKPSGNPLEPSPEHSFQTLPDVFQERLVGGNVAYYADRRNSLGLTAYGAMAENLVSGVDLDFQEWSRWPGTRYGAVGANFAYGRNWLDVFGEAAVSFDALPTPDPSLTKAKGGGGPAGLLRATATRKNEELELVARYYSTDYANPYARPIGQPDEFEGQRARDEAGGRIRYIRTGKELVIRALADVWVNPSNGGDEPKIDTYVRVNVRTTPQLWLGLWERYQDKDLTRGGNAQCFEISTENDENGEPIPCGGRQITTIARATYEPSRTYSATLQIQHQLVDDGTSMSRPEYASKFRQDLAIWFIGYYRPNKNLRMRVRARYFDEAIDNNAYLERSFATLIDTAFRMRTRDTLRVRFDTRFWLDNRMSTLDRVPNPELSLWLFYEARL